MLRSVIIVTQSEPFHVFEQVRDQLGRMYAGEFDFSIYESGLLDEKKDLREESIERVKEADFVFMYLHGTVTNFKSFMKYLPFLTDKKFFFCTGMEEENKKMADRMNLYPAQYKKILNYYNNGDEKNISSLFLYVVSKVTKTADYIYEEPDRPKWQGIFDGKEGAKDEEGCIEQIKNCGTAVIGILLHWNSYIKNDTRHAAAIMEEIRRNGMTPYCVYSQIVPDEEQGFGGVRHTFGRYFISEGRVLIDALINLTSFSVTVLANPGNGGKTEGASVFEILGVPVFQVMVSAYTYEEWKTAPAGIHPQTLPYQVFQPEFDGQIITYPVGYTEKVIEGNEEKSISTPIRERTEKLCRLVCNWARLKRVPGKEKKIAVLFHNIPPRNDTIGCASGLDSPESVYRMVEALKEDGLVLDHDFKDGQEIIRKIIDGVTNDGRWSSEQQLLEKSTDLVGKDKYNEWFLSFPEKVREELVRDWGTPPGEYMAAGGSALIPGIINGNLFIGLQPPRALMEKADELLHNTDIVCPHQYLAFYRWIEEVFQANAVIHVGTHGTLEWLPGKEVGLCGSCYPDLAIGTLPNFYPYIISNPGEGTQAKRRSYCSILDYMIPSFVESGTYDELADLDGMLKEYYHFMLTDKERVLGIAQRIWNLAREKEVTRDIGLTDEDAGRDLDGCIDKIHAWISRIQSYEIKDGLHIYGDVPQDERLRNLIRVLLRVKNGSVPSLREGLCEAAGEKLEELLQNPAALRPSGRTNAMVLEELDEWGRQIFLDWEKDAYAEDKIEEILGQYQERYQGRYDKLKSCLQFAAEEVKPRIMRTSREIDSLVGAWNGKMVPTGQSGCPTRGNVHLLPTGKNFYSVDPSAIPSRSAWEVGVRLADQLLERYEADEGKIPESVAILVYATEAMRTTGDDIAEILWLLGIRPVWLGSSDRVVGLEVIPPQELKRPRIDVTLRITGLLRDTFPNLIEQIEDAVNLTASLDESYEINFVKKHIETEVREFLDRGVDREEAFERASLRIFGDPPGTYGAGVKELVYAKKWETNEDLGKIFTAWGCHAYGKKLHGEKRYEDFANRLSKADVSVKNESNIENDMLGSDDFYNYFGGLACAVEVHSHGRKAAYIPTTANKDNLEIYSLHEEASKIMRARINNPRWIEGLKKHGYKGAQEVSAMTDIVFGWDATTGVIDDWMYSAIARRYVFQKENAGWIEEVNPFAMQNITERLLEASARGMWNASEEELDGLRSVYMDIEGEIEGMNE